MVRLYGDMASQQALTQMDVTPGNNRRGKENSSEHTDHNISMGYSHKSIDKDDQENGVWADDQSASGVGDTAAAHERACKVVDGFHGALNPYLVLSDIEPFETRMMRWRSGVIHDPEAVHIGDPL